MMRYDIKGISRETGFEPRFIEKVLKISDVLQEISRIKFLHKRLSLYGGTALNFVYFQGIPRLSFDLDFNYRQVTDADWGEGRNEIDKQIKQLLNDLDYVDIAIQPSYPLLRMDVKYSTTNGLRDSFKIETGYLRRMPILRNDVLANFNHIGSNENFKILTPLKEELFSNKVATLLYRGRSNDLFDVYNISKLDFNLNLFKKCFVIECIIRGLNPKEIDISETLKSISFESKLKETIRGGKLPDDIIHGVKNLLEHLFNSLNKEEVEFIEIFYNEGRLELNKIDEGNLNPLLDQHPSILWALKNRKDGNR